MSEIDKSQVIWASVWASAAVAAFTTLLIEYLAKPWLEVRKERILERDRRRRSALNGLRRALFLTGRILALRDEQGHESFRERASSIAVDIEPLVMAAIEDLDVSEKLEEDWNDATGAMVAAAVIAHQEAPSEQVWNGLDLASDKVDLFADLLSTPRWRWWRRRAFVRKIRAIASPATAEGDEAAVRAVQQYLSQHGLADRRD
ncbi:hypothetical protein ACIA47_11165 [Micromonospora sp. NPDC051227]|uniref:hypothetical protein n=1 Tax=Micromonospora sp. NPDC051227 TaxID=3364285 RepID=UPI003793BDAD